MDIQQAKAKKYVQWFRILGWLEGISFLVLLFIAVPMKYAGHNPNMVHAMGPVHGTLFLAYVALASMVADQKSWMPKRRMLSYLAAVLPFGTFVFERKYLLD